jgi:hypothetical protein
MASTPAAAGASSGPADRALREQAITPLRTRDFNAHLVIYALVNTVAWAVWLVLGLSTGR